MKNLFLAIFILVLSIGLFFNFYSQSGKAQPVDMPDIIIRDAAFTISTRNRLVFTVENIGSANTSQSVQVDVAYLDSSGSRISGGQAEILSIGLAAGASFIFDTENYIQRHLLYSIVMDRPLRATRLRLTADPILRGEDRIDESDEEMCVESSKIN